MPTITIDMDRKCGICDKEGALPSGICLACFTKYRLPGILKKIKPVKIDKPSENTPKTHNQS